jgi:pimeloyl-ACP methyl ester carboxylesterase
MTAADAGPDVRTAVRRFATEARPGIVASPRYRARYVVWGSGPPLVFAHGLTDRAKSFALVMPRLADRFTCIAVELANSLDDGANLTAYRHHHHVDDLVCVLNHLGYDRVDLVGSSYGSTIALRTLALAPDRVRRCILSGGFARRPLAWFERIPAILARPWPGRIGDVLGRRLVLGRLDKAQFACAAPDVYRLFRDCTNSTPIRALTHRTLLLASLDLRPTLPSIPHSVLLIGGDDDRIVPQKFRAELAAGLTNVRQVEIAGCGHGPQYTHPGPMADAIREFLLT